MIVEPRRFDLQGALLAATALVGIAAAVAYWAHRGSLWEDEVIAITHGLQPFPTFFVEMVRDDIHPFFYFLLLKLWTSLNFDSDAWALASSLACALLSAAVVIYVTLRVHGVRAALWAGAIFCSLPTFAWSAGNLRMYGLVPGIAVGCWYANRRFLQTGRNGWAMGLVIVQLLQIYTHAIGFFFVGFFALAALIEQWSAADRRRLTTWVILQAACVACALPVALSALVRGTEPLAASSLSSLSTYPAQLLTAPSPGRPLPLLAGDAAFALLLLLGLSSKRARVPVLVIPCGALLVCIVISSLGKPMFKPPVFTANLVAFLVIGAAAALAQLQTVSLRLLATAGVIVASLATLAWAQESRVPANYRPAAEFVATHAMPGDVVVIPNVSVFWGIARYAVGPRWGKPLEVMRADNEAWSKLKARLGPRVVDWLGLNPKTDRISHNGVDYILGSSAKVPESPARIWIVYRDNYKETVEFNAPVRATGVTWFGDELAVTEALGDAAGTAAVVNPISPIANPNPSSVPNSVR